MSEWKKVRLEDVATVDWGNTDLTKKFYTENGSYLGVSASGCDGRMDHFEHEADVIVVSAIGANCGKVFYPRQRFTAIKNTITITPHTKKIDPNYLFLTLCKNTFPKRGSAQPFISKGDAEKYKILFPPLKEQKAIAGVLGSLDDKIEHNRRMIETLEAMGKALFQSWFVDFDPVRAKAAGRPTELPDAISTLFPNELVSSQLGDIPKGWEIKRLGEITKIKQGKYRANISHQPTKESSIPLWGGNGIRGYVSESDFDEPTTLITCRGASCGLIQKAFEPSAFTNSVIAFVNIKNESTFSFIYNHSLVADFVHFITGSAQPQITISNIEKHKLIYPSFELQKHFDILVEGVHKKILAVSEENQVLAQLRDTLLPKLMSGELRVKDVQ